MKPKDTLTDFPKLERDGKIAVLYSPGYGAGWSTWNNSNWGPLLTAHRDIVELVLSGCNEAAGQKAESIIRAITGKPDDYVCVLGAGNLRVEWIAKGDRYRIDEYDGSESIETLGSDSYITA